MGTSSTLIGIDLGTTNCTVTAIDLDGKTTVIKNRDGEFLTPSAVYFQAEPNSVVVGKRAKEMSRTDPKNLVMFVKREMGKGKDEVRFDSIDRKANPYKFWDRTLSPEDISAYILLQLKQDAEAVLKTTITDAVITCPAYFGSKEKDATRLAGEIAKLNVLEVIPEPTAAALSYGAITEHHNETIFVFDLGGGTFDVTILRVNQGPNGKVIETVSTDGDRKLGGKDWDDLLIAHMITEFNEKYGIDLDFEDGPEKDLSYGRLRLDVEKAKIQLSSTSSVSISMEYGGSKLLHNLTLEAYETITAELVNTCRSYCNNALKDAGMTWDRIDTVVMVGSMSNSPPIQKALASWSGKKIHFGIVNPKTCVSEGAAIMGHTLRGGKTIETLVEKPRYDDLSGDSTILEHAQSLQETGARRKTVIDRATNVVASTVGIIARNSQGSYVVDQIIRKNTTYPTLIKKTYPLSADNMITLDIKVVEGESRNPEECDKLGVVSLGLNGRLAKGDKVEVALSIDESGILQVSALDIKNGVKVESTIRRDGAPTKEQIQESTDKLDLLTLG